MNDRLISKSEESGEEPSLEQLDLRFRYTKWIFNLAMIAVGVLFVWSTHALLVWINHRIATADGPAAFREFPQTAIWWFFPFFGALSLSYEITLQVWSLLGDRRSADLYTRWSNEKTALKTGRFAGLDSRRVLRWLFVVVALPIGILTIWALPMHVSIEATMIRDCGYGFKPCEIYPYATAQRLTIISGFRDKDGKLRKRAGIVLDSSNGSRWSSADMGNFQETVDPTLVEYLATKTGAHVSYAESASDIPPLTSER